MQAFAIDNHHAVPAEPAVRLVIPPDPRFTALVRRRCASFARRHGVPEADVALFVTALGEALANAVEHAKTEREIVATCSLAGDRLIATVLDTGTGFADARRRAEEARTPEPTAERGRGLAIMRSCTDHVAVRSVAGQGTAVTLVRFIRPESSRRRAAPARGG